MSKRKAPVDPFGLSLMDVLSNALGGVILLMLIVAATIKGKDKEHLNRLPEDDQGAEHTAVEFVRGKPALKSLMLVQIELLGGEGTLILSGEKQFCSLSKRRKDQAPEMDSLHQTSPYAQDWLIIRNGNFSGTWKVDLEIDPNGNRPDSVGVFISTGTLIKCVITTKLILNKKTILEVREQKNGEPEITIAGQPCQ